MMMSWYAGVGAATHDFPLHRYKFRNKFIKHPWLVTAGCN